MNNNQEFISVNGNIIKENDAKISAVQAGLFYGAGCFETFKAKGDSIFRFNDHYQRLIKGLHYLEVPEKLHPGLEILRTEISELLKKNNLKKSIARVRVQISLDEKKGYSRDENLKLIQIISCNTFIESTKPAKLIMSKTRTVPVISRPPNLKLSNMLHYRAAFREALRAGADDAILLSSEGFVAETSVANLFWKTGNVISTPSVKTDILPGIMRSALICIIQEKTGFRLKEGCFYPDDMKKAESVWLTNSVKEIQIVKSMDEAVYKTDDLIFGVLKSELSDLISKESN